MIVGLYLKTAHKRSMTYFSSLSLAVHGLSEGADQSAVQRLPTVAEAQPALKIVALHHALLCRIAFSDRLTKEAALAWDAHPDPNGFKFLFLDIRMPTLAAA